MDEDIRRGHNVKIMGDFNTPLNDIKNQPKNVATERLLQWEETGDIRILNNKEIPTRKPDKSTEKANCIDVMAITKGLENRISNYRLDTEQVWSPAAVQAKTDINRDTAAYLRGKPTDHKAQMITLHLDLVENGPAGNRAIINYNNREGWKKYYKVSDKYAKPKVERIKQKT